MDSGSFDIAAFLKTLHELGYKGPIGLQCYGIGGDAHDHLARSMAAWQKLSGADSKLAFTESGKEYSFDTGVLRGMLRTQGKSVGLGPLLDCASGTNVSRFHGIFSHYRMFDSNTRYGEAAWDWASTAQLLTNGAVEVRWTADTAHPYDMTALYRWSKPDTLDLLTTVALKTNVSRFEIFLASYFEGFPSSFVSAKGDIPVFIETKQPNGDWQAFPRDEEAAKIIADGRWTRPPHPVDWKIMPRYASPLGIRRDAASGLTGLVMAPTSDCFAVLSPYGAESHRSMYLSLFGRDFKAGETASARSRLVIGHNITDDKATAIYEAYAKEIGRSGDRSQ